MAKRVCVKCGKEKDIEGGRICIKNQHHFVCKQCVYADWFGELKYCPICKGKLG